MTANREMFKKYENKLDSTTRFTLELWFTMVRKYNLERETKILTWMAYNPKFKPGTIDSSFEHWINEGITAISTMTDWGKIKGFLNLKKDYGLEDYDQFRYLQVRDFFEKEIKPDLPQELKKVTTTLCNAYKNKTGRVISLLYQGLLQNRGISTLYIRDRWVKESKIPLTEEDWFNICDIQRTTTNSRLWKEFCWKNTVRFLLSKLIN